MQIEEKPNLLKEKNIQKIAETFIATKSERAFKCLYDRLKPGITNHCYKILKDMEQAEDAFANTMGKIWEKIHQYNDERGNFSTWSYNIARNESLAILKIKRRYSIQDSMSLELLATTGPGLNSTNDVYLLEEDPAYSFFNEGDTIDSVYDEVLEEIRNLPALYKNIMIDREIHGMKYKDIADKYDVKKKSVATRIRRARLQIKGKMEKASKNIRNV